MAEAQAEAMPFEWTLNPFSARAARLKALFFGLLP
jgi:hypothetical protein